MKIFVSVLLIVIFSLTVFGSCKKPSQKPLEIHYFYMQACASCDDEREFREWFAELVRDVEDPPVYTLLTTNVFQNDTPYSDLCAEKDLEPVRNWPVLFIGDTALYGQSAIEEGTLRLFGESRE